MTRIAAFLFLLCFASAANACPGCSDAVAASDPNFAKGVFWGILFFLTVPALLVGGIALAIRRARRAAERLQTPRGASDGERGVALGESPDPIR